MRKTIYSPENKPVEELLAELRKAAGLTQRELAKALKRPYSMVGRIETGQRRVDVLEFNSICKVLKADARAKYCELLDRIDALSRAGGKVLEKAAEPKANYKIHRPAK